MHINAKASPPRTRSFLRSARGNVAMMFAIALMPLMIGAGAGLDFARGMMVRQQMSEALDAAALAVGSSTGLDPDQRPGPGAEIFQRQLHGGHDRLRHACRFHSVGRL